MRTFSDLFAPSLFRVDPFWLKEFDNEHAPAPYSPEVDIIETQNSYLLGFDLPGIKKENIQIEVKENVLTVSGERRWETKTEEPNMRRFERRYGNFARSFTLPSTVDASRVEANYEDGVLEISLPKTQLAAAKKIEIQSGKSSAHKELVDDKKTSTPPSVQ